MSISDLVALTRKAITPAKVESSVTGQLVGEAGPEVDVDAGSPALAAIERSRRRPSRARVKPEPRPSTRVAKQATPIATGERAFEWGDDDA